jgi:hypothetical protein
MGQDRITYGDWTIYFDPPPIPIRTMDWHFTHSNFDASYEGGEDGWTGNGLSGSAASAEACKREINDIEEDRAMPRTRQRLVMPLAVATYARCRAAVHDGKTRGCACAEIAGRLIARAEAPHAP